MEVIIDLVIGVIYLSSKYLGNIVVVFINNLFPNFFLEKNSDISAALGLFTFFAIAIAIAIAISAYIWIQY